jgi:5S rRNA maturation endonuclease (ribonuclease M5)
MNSVERLERTLTELKESTTTKLVEGKNDRKALEYFGIGNVRTLNSSLVKVAESLQGSKEVIILTDYDRRGELLTKRLCELLSEEGIRCNLDFRKDIRFLTGIKTFEDLVPKYEKMKEYKGVNHGKNLRRYGKIRRSRKHRSGRHS